MFAAIEGAMHNINLETYIFDDDKIGNEFANALIVKQQQGVQVNIIYDGWGSVLTRGSFFERMRSSGIRLVEFDPVVARRISKVGSTQGAAVSILLTLKA